MIVVNWIVLVSAVRGIGVVVATLPYFGKEEI